MRATRLRALRWALTSSWHSWDHARRTYVLGFALGQLDCSDSYRDITSTWMALSISVASLVTSTSATSLVLSSPSSKIVVFSGVSLACYSFEKRVVFSTTLSSFLSVNRSGWTLFHGCTSNFRWIG